MPRAGFGDDYPAETVLNRHVERRGHRGPKQWTTLARLRRLVFVCGAMLVIVSFIAAGSLWLQQEDIARSAQTGLAGRAVSAQGEVLILAATVAGLVAMLVLGRQIALTISQPLTGLRDTIVRQRAGESGAQPREDLGSAEIRSVASEFNALVKQNFALQQVQARALGTHQLTFEMARAIRGTLNTQDALDVVCVGLGEGLGADRVVADTLGLDQELLLGGQWHRSDLLPLEDLILLPSLGAFAEELWQSTGFRAQYDLLEVDEESREIAHTFYGKTGARAVIMVPLGLQERVIGMIYVLQVNEPRTWSTSEINLVQAVAGFLARAIVEAEHQVHQREYVARIERLDRQKSDFLATVSHELRTPLTSISGYVELLAEEDAGELTVQQHGMLEVIQRNTGRLRSLVEDVIMLSRIERGVTKAHHSAVAIHALIARVTEELSPLADDNAIQLEIDNGPEAAIVLGDQGSLDRAVINILSNAIKFSRPGGVVSIRARLDQDAGRAVITCQDHGIGIPAHDLADLFTRFFRASNATDQAIPGTGLGLSIAKQIVEDHHGGQLRLSSVEAKGTTVVIDLPLYEPAQIAGAGWNDSESDDVFDIRT